MEWCERVVAELIVLRRQGHEFPAAWRRALSLHPARARDLGEERPTLFSENGEAESVVEFTRRACWDAWHGERPALRHFCAESLMLPNEDRLVVDRPRPSQRVLL